MILYDEENKRNSGKIVGVFLKYKKSDSSYGCYSYISITNTNNNPIFGGKKAKPIRDIVSLSFVNPLKLLKHIALILKNRIKGSGI